MHPPAFTRPRGSLSTSWAGSGVVGTFLIPLTPGEYCKGNRDKSEGARPFYLHFRSAGWQGDPFLELKLLNSAQFISICEH